MESFYFGRDGKPMSPAEWVDAMENGDRQVDRTEVGDAVVSTVWMGINHQFGDGPPLIFETMIFDGPLDQAQWRYATEAEAIAGHAKAVKEAKAAI